MKKLLKIVLVTAFVLVTVFLCRLLIDDRNTTILVADSPENVESKDIYPGSKKTELKNIGNDVAGGSYLEKHDAVDVNSLISKATKLQDFLEVWAHIQQFAPSEAKLTQLNLLMQKWAALMPHESSLKILDLGSGHNRTSLLRTWFSFAPIEDSGEMHRVWQEMFPEERRVLTTAIASNIENNLRFNNVEKLLLEYKKSDFNEMEKIILSKLGKLAAKDKISLNDGLSKLTQHANNNNRLKDVFITDWFNESASESSGYDSVKNLFNEVVSSTSDTSDVGSTAVMGAAALLYSVDKQEARKLFESIGWNNKIAILATQSITTDLVFADLQAAGEWVAAIPNNSEASTAGKRILINKLIELNSYDEAYSWVNKMPVGAYREEYTMKLKRLTEGNVEN